MNNCPHLTIPDYEGAELASDLRTHFENAVTGTPMLKKRLPLTKVETDGVFISDLRSVIAALITTTMSRSKKLWHH
jgi:hypothetical protein